ncbi:MAG: alkaline phosphatase family protein [Nitrososphaerales archaeon]
MGKVIVVGLDGATFDIMKPMFAQGRLRNFKELMENGTSGTLTSTILPLSATAWNSFATGKNAGKHGIYDFSKRVQGTYTHRPTTALDRGTRTIWDYASSLGKKCCIVNVPLTYPTEKVNGIMISGFPYPESRQDYAIPREILSEIREKLGVTSLHKPSPHFLKSGDERKLVDEMLAITKRQTDVLNYLLVKDKWDMFVTVFDATDVISHFFWQYIDPKNPKYDAKKAAEFGPLFYDVYESIDLAFGEMRKNISSDDQVFVISDHGFGPVYYAVYVNNWLIDNNYLRLGKSTGTTLRKFLFRLGITSDFLFRTAKALRVVGPRTFTYSKKSRMLGLANTFSLSLEDIAWDETLVYSYGNYGQLFLNVRGREPNGKVEAGEEYNRLVAELVVKLKELKDPKTGKILFDIIYTKDQIYSGKFYDAAPDIIFFDSTMTYRAHRLFEFGSRKMIAPDPIYSGSHRMDGIFVAGGRDIAKGNLDANLIDLAPTILHLLGLPLIPDMDGKVLTGLFVPESESSSRKVTYASESSEQTQKLRNAILNLKKSGKKI